jgi:Uma2 family endonuclease
MPTLASPPASLHVSGSLRRFSVEEYHQMIQIGILDENDNVELIEGYVVNKMSRNPPHDSAIRILSKYLERLLPPGWDFRVQSAITLSDSEPEPDLAVVRGDFRSYGTHHPHAADVGLVVEVSESSLAWDRTEKTRIYARAGIETYWIINLVDRQVEVYTGPTGTSASPGYARRDDVPVGGSVSLVLDGVVLAALAVSELLP